MIFVGNVDMGSGANRYIWPTLLIGAGSVLVWRQADNARRARWMEVGSRRRVLHLVRGSPGSPWSAWAWPSSWWYAAPPPSSATY